MFRREGREGWDTQLLWPGRSRPPPESEPQPCCSRRGARGYHSGAGWASVTRRAPRRRLTGDFLLPPLLLLPPEGWPGWRGRHRQPGHCGPSFPALRGNAEVEAGAGAAGRGGKALRNGARRAGEVCAARWTWPAGDAGTRGPRVAAAPRRPRWPGPGWRFLPCALALCTPDPPTRLGSPLPGRKASAGLGQGRVGGAGVPRPLPSAMRAALATCPRERRHSSTSTRRGRLTWFLVTRPRIRLPYSAGRFLQA